MSRPARPLRAQPDRASARRQRAHGAVQLAAGARPRRHVHPPHRGHGRRAVDAPSPSSDSRGPALARARLGRGPGPRRTACGPYRAVRAAGLYQSYARELIGRRLRLLLFLHARAARGRARRRRWPPGCRRDTPGRCRAIDPAEAARARRGRRAGRRSGFACPRTRDVVFEDLVRGEVTFNTDVIGDPVIVRSDGRPAYNFAVVVDDALMEVTHVIRGEDHISNTPRQICCTRRSGSRRRSSRICRWCSGRTTRRCPSGTAPRASWSFASAGICRRRWSTTWRCWAGRPARARSSCRLREMARRFDSAREPQRAVFDMGKLVVDEPALHEGGGAGAHRARVASTYFVRRGLRDAGDRMRRSVSHEPAADGGGSVDRLEEIPDRVAFVFAGTPSSALRRSFERSRTGARRRGGIRGRDWSTAGPLDRDAFRAAAARARDKTGLKGRALFHPIRVALTGGRSGPELDLAVPAIDRGRGARRRIGHCRRSRRAPSGRRSC